MKFAILKFKIGMKAFDNCGFTSRMATLYNGIKKKATKLQIFSLFFLFGPPLQGKVPQLPSVPELNALRRYIRRSGFSFSLLPLLIYRSAAAKPGPFLL